MDYAGHLGMTVTDAKRCCKNCSVILGTMGERNDVGPFISGELEPLNEEAQEMNREISRMIQ